MTSAVDRVLPNYIRSLLRAHTYLSSSANTSINSTEVARSLLQQKNLTYKRNLLLSPNPLSSSEKAFLLRDYPEAVRPHLESIFNKPITLDDDLSAESFGLRDQKPNNIAPISKTTSARRKTDFGSSIFQVIYSHFYPLVPDEQVPELRQIANKSSPVDDRKTAGFLPKSALHNSYKWIQRTLDHTPIVFVLSHTNRLFSESSLNQVNPSKIRFQNALNELNLAPYASSSTSLDRIKPSYHFSDLRKLDLFNHYLGGASDPLVQEILSKSVVQVTDASFQPLSDDPETLNSIEIAKYPSSRDEVPYDLKYNDFTILTIDKKHQEQSHEKLLALLERSTDDYEIVGVRVSLASPWVQSNMVAANSKTDDTKPSGSSYDDLLNSLNKPQLSPSSFEVLMKGLGEMGLTEVKRGDNCIYLLREE